MRRAFLLVVLVVALPVAVPGPETAPTLPDQASAESTVPPAPPVITDPVEEPPPTPENETMWLLLGVSALSGIVLLLVHVWSSDRPSRAEREVPSAGKS